MSSSGFGGLVCLWSCSFHFQFHDLRLVSLILAEKARNGRISFKNRFYTLARFPRSATQFFDCQVVKLILPPLRVVRALAAIVLVVKRTIVATVVEIYSHAQALRGTIGRESDNSAEIKAFASFSSRIAKFAVMLDVAIFLPRFLFQGTVSLIRERWQSNIIRGESQRSRGGLEHDMRPKRTETRTFCAVLGSLQWLDNPAAAPSRANVQGWNASHQLLKEWRILSRQGCSDTLKGAAALGRRRFQAWAQCRPWRGKR